MFGTWLRAAITFLAAPPLLWAWAYAMDPIVSVVEGFGVSESPLPGYLSTTIEWLPIIVLMSLIFWVVSAAITHREATGGGY